MSLFKEDPLPKFLSKSSELVEIFKKSNKKN